MTELTVEENNKPPALWIPISLFFAAWGMAVLHAHKWEIDRAIWMVSRDPGYLIEALGAAFPLLIGLIHLLISQFFKNKRNPSSRRKIIIGYSIAAISILLFVAFTSR
jgi:hypothetical protein